MPRHRERIVLHHFWKPDRLGRLYLSRLRNHAETIRILIQILEGTERIRVAKATRRLVVPAITILFLTGILSPLAHATSQTIGSIGTADGAALPFQRHTFTTNTGAIFTFYCDGTHLAYSGSVDGGTTWTVHILSSYSCTTGAFQALWYDGAFVYYATGNTAVCSGTGVDVCYSVGTISGSTISFDASQSVHLFSTAETAYGVSIITDDSGNIWIAASGFNSPFDFAIAKCACSQQQTWINASSFPTSFAGTSVGNGVLVPLTAAKIAFVYTTSNSGHVNVKSWSGSAFQTVATTTDTVSSALAFSAVGIADNLWIVFSDGNIQSIIYHYSTNTFDTETSVGTTSPAYPVLSYDTTSHTLYAFWWDGSNTINYNSNPTPLTATIGSWTGVQTLTTGEVLSNAYDIGSAYSQAQYAGFDLIPIVWETGTNPYPLKFTSLSVKTPNGPGSLPSQSIVSVTGPGGVPIPPQLADQNVLSIMDFLSAGILASSIQFTKKKKRKDSFTGL
jgi:hypothetical protein